MWPLSKWYLPDYPQFHIDYTYDGKGALVKRSSTDGTWTVYIGGPDGQGIYEKRQDGSYVTYYNGLGRRIAMRVHPPEAAPARCTSSCPTSSAARRRS